MNFTPQSKSSFLKRVAKRLGIDPDQRPYYFYMPNTRTENGSLIALAAVFMLVMSVMIPIAMTMVSNIRSNTSQAQLYVAGAQNAAKAGLEDTLGYFVRQNKLMTAFTASVTAGVTPTYATGVSFVDQPFNPIYNTSNATYSDTGEGLTVNLSGGITNAFYGLSNEYSIDAAANTVPASGKTTAVYFARYEVAEQTNPVVVPTPTLNPIAVHDISGNREANYVNGDGTVWAITSTGYIYKRSSYTMDTFGEWAVPYNVYPNKVLATAKAYTEFRKLSCNLPNSGSGDAAIYVAKSSNVTETSYASLNGKAAGGYALCAMSGSATAPGGATSSNFFGSGYTFNGSSNAPISDVNVFGMSIKDVQFIADYVGSSSATININGTSNKLTYYNGSITFGGTSAVTTYQSLNATGIMIVNGNLTMNASSPSSICYYGGIVFVTGNLTISNGADIDGLVIMGYSSVAPSAGGTVMMTGGAGNFGFINANPNVVTNALQMVAQYREDISARRVLLAFPGI